MILSVSSILSVKWNIPISAHVRARPVTGRTLNGHPLLEFTMSSSEPAREPLRIKRAILWARVEKKTDQTQQHHRHRNITLWVFRVHCGNRTHLRGKVIHGTIAHNTGESNNFLDILLTKKYIQKLYLKKYTKHKKFSTSPRIVSVNIFFIIYLCLYKIDWLTYVISNAIGAGVTIFGYVEVFPNTWDENEN